MGRALTGSRDQAAHFTSKITAAFNRLRHPAESSRRAHTVTCMRLAGRDRNSVAAAHLADCNQSSVAAAHSAGRDQSSVAARWADRVPAGIAGSEPLASSSEYRIGPVAGTRPSSGDRTATSARPSSGDRTAPYAHSPAAGAPASAYARPTADAPALANVPAPAYTRRPRRGIVTAAAALALTACLAAPAVAQAGPLEDLGQALSSIFGAGGGLPKLRAARRSMMTKTSSPTRKAPATPRSTSSTTG